MRMIAILIALAVVLMAWASLPARAGVACWDTADPAAYMAQKYGEALQSSASMMTRAGLVIVETWAAPSGAWTMTMRNAGTAMCIMHFGQHWRGEAPGVDG